MGNVFNTQKERLLYAQIPLHTFSRNFFIDEEVANLLRTCWRANKSAMGDNVLQYPCYTHCVENPLASTPPRMSETHPTNILVGGDVNGNIPQYYYVLLDIADRY